MQLQRCLSAYLLLGYQEGKKEALDADRSRHDVLTVHYRHREVRPIMFSVPHSHGPLGEAKFCFSAENNRDSPWKFQPGNRQL